MTSSDQIEELVAEARYHRERLQLYRARVHGSRPTAVIRLQELERLSNYADRRLRRVKREGL
jgi:hypothetical protein